MDIFFTTKCCRVIVPLYVYNVLNLAGFYLKSFPMPSHQMTTPGIAIIYREFSTQLFCVEVNFLFACPIPLKRRRGKKKRTIIKKLGALFPVLNAAARNIC